MAQGSAQFETTLWSQVLLAARAAGSPDGRRALTALCANYWLPIYGYFRRQGRSREDAEDLTQAFFEHILANDFLAKADPGRGRFRSFLLGAARFFASNAHDRATAQRRGGGVERIPIDAAAAEQWLALQPTALNDSTRAFDRAWALTVIHNAVQTLEAEQRRAGKLATFSALREFLQRPAAPGEYERIAESLGLTKGAIAAAVHRLNERLGQIVRDAVRDTVVEAGMAEDELRFLFAALRD